LKKSWLIFAVVLVFIFLYSHIITDAFASANPEILCNRKVEQQVWKELASSPDHLALFSVSIRESGSEDRVSIVHDQMLLERTLEALQFTGSVREYHPNYGSNTIYVYGSRNAVNFLADWPGIASITHQEITQGTVFNWLLDNSSVVGTASGQITGTVTGPDGFTPLSGIQVTAYRQTGPTTWVVESITLTDADGTYTHSDLPTGLYRAKFSDPDGSNLTEFYDNQSEWLLATNFNVLDAQTTVGIDASLGLAGKIAGTLTKISDGSPASDIVVSAYLTGESLPYNSEVTASDGTYTLGDLEAGTYQVRFSDGYDPPRYLTEYYDNVVDRSQATDITVVAGEIVLNVDASLGLYGWISGTVVGDDAVTPIRNVNIDVWQYNSDWMDWEWVSYGNTDSSGVYNAFGLITEDYRVEFYDPDGQFVGEFYNNQPDIETAANVHVELGEQTSGIDAMLATAIVIKNLTLTEGWNLISIPLDPLETSPEDTLASLSGGYDQVFAYQGCVPGDPWLKYIPGGPPQFNTLTSMDAEHGYWLNTTDPGVDILNVSGSLPVTTTINLCTGWNLIGYASWNEKPVEDVLDSIAGKFDLMYTFDAADTVDPWKKFDPSAANPITNDLTTMKPWSGYWINITDPASLTIYSR
jgi:hypothetical protein